MHFSVALSLGWWVYIFICLFGFTIFMIIHYIVKKLNEARFDDRIQRLYSTNSVSVQVAPPLLDIESKNQLSKYSKQDRRLSKNAEGISLIFTKEENEDKARKTISNKRIRHGVGLKWYSSDNLLNVSKTCSKVIVSKANKACSTSYIPLDTVCALNDDVTKRTPENIIISKVDVNEDLSKKEQMLESNREPKEEKSVLGFKTDLQKSNEENISISSADTYTNFLGAIYNPKTVSRNNIFDKATTSKVISKTELNERSEYEVLTINPVDDKSTNSKVTLNTIDKENLKTNSEVSSLPDDIKKSVSFKLDTKSLTDEKNNEKDDSETEIGISDISASSKINYTNEVKEGIKTVAKVAKTPDLISSTSKVSFKPESVTIYIDDVVSDSDITQSISSELHAADHSMEKRKNDGQNTSKNEGSDETLQNSIKTESNIQMNVFCEPINYRKDSSSIKSLKRSEINSSSNYNEETDKETMLKLMQDTIHNPSFTNSEEAHEENTKKSVSILKFTDRDSDDDSNCNVSKRLSPERVRRSASRVTFVDEVVSISTGNIFRINSKTNAFDKTSPKSDSFERDSRGSFLDEMAFFKYKLDQKLDTLMRQEASTSRRDDSTYHLNHVVLKQLYLSGDARVFEGIASDSNINDTTRRLQGPIHETVSLDRSEFSSTKSWHEEKKDGKKGKDDKRKDYKRKDR